MCVIRGLILPSETWLNRSAISRGATSSRRGFPHFLKASTTVTECNLPEPGQALDLMCWRLDYDYKRLANAEGVGDRMTRGLVAFVSNQAWEGRPEEVKIAVSLGI